MCGICTSVEHLPDMCPTLQESETESTKYVGALGGEHQYGRQLYPNCPFDNQQFWRQTPTESESGATYNIKGPRYQAPPFRPQQHQQMSLWENNPAMEYLILQFQLSITATVQDLKIHMGQLNDTVSQIQSASFRTIPSQTIPNLMGGGVGMTRLRSGRELPQSIAPLPTPRPITTKAEPGAKDVPLPFPNRAVVAKRFEINEDLLNLFRKVEINIPLLDAIN
ncbi:hypothetical protein CR513_51196, partial [Mucuna pruriens]